MVLEELVARHYSKDYFGIAIERAGSFASYLGMKKLGKDVKEFGAEHQKLMHAHEYRIKEIFKKYGFDERLLKRYLGWISGTIMLKRYCIENGYSKEFNEMYKKFKPVLRKSILSKDYWVCDENYLKKLQWPIKKIK